MENNEKKIKNYIISTYGKYMSPKDLDYISKKDYSNINNEYLLEEAILKDIIHVSTHKEIILNEDDSISIPYGETLEYALIHYLMNKLNKIFNLNIKEKQELNDIINSLKEIDKNNIIEDNIFNKNAIELENIEELSSIAIYCNNIDLNTYTSKLNSIKRAQKENSGIDVDLTTMLNNTSAADKNSLTTDLSSLLSELNNTSDK